MITPTLRLERSLLRQGHLLVAGVDEVGRGALAGPVTVGVVLVDGTVRSATPGLRDSKLLTPKARAALMPKLQRWPLAWAVGHAEPAEIDELGIIACLRLAAVRAFAQLPAPADIAILDGNHNYLRARAAGAGEQLSLFAPEQVEPVNQPATVLTRIKADMSCSTVAAASVLAKVTRDELMITRAGAAPHYQWNINKGYASPEHLAALREHGPCGQHRQSWSLPTAQAGGQQEFELGSDRAYRASDPSDCVSVQLSTVSG
ncbi:MAG: ribonuclease HII [Candidatus Nanopelagicales bacterium]